MDTTSHHCDDGSHCDSGYSRDDRSNNLGAGDDCRSSPDDLGDGHSNLDDPDDDHSNCRDHGDPNGHSEPERRYRCQPPEQ
ncbi:hypothetical protein D3C72_2371400 [compost metagenome]